MRDAGTPALPMDIRYVESDQYTFELDAGTGGGRLSLRASTLSVEHMMDNFTLRPPPLTPMGMPNYRQSDPRGDTDTAAVVWELEQAGWELALGADADWESHTGRITDPTNARYYIDNFNDVDRDRAGLFGNLTRAAGAWEVEAGLRYNKVRMDAGEVSGDLATMPGSPMSVRITVPATVLSKSHRTERS